MSLQTNKYEWSKEDLLRLARAADGAIQQGEVLQYWLSVAQLVMGFNPTVLLIASGDPIMNSVGKDLRSAAYPLMNMVPEHKKRVHGCDLYTLIRESVEGDKAFKSAVISVIVNAWRNLPLPKVVKDGLVPSGNSRPTNTFCEFYSFHLSDVPSIVLYRCDEKCGDEITKRNAELDSSISQELAKLSDIISGLPADTPSVSSDDEEQERAHLADMRERAAALPPIPYSLQQPYGPCSSHSDAKIRYHANENLITDHQRVQIQASTLDQLMRGIANVKLSTSELDAVVTDAHEFFYNNTSRDLEGAIAAIQSLIVNAFEYGRSCSSTTSSKADTLSLMSMDSHSKDPFSDLHSELQYTLKCSNISNMVPINLGGVNLIPRRWIDMRPNLVKATQLCGMHLGLRPVLSIDSSCYWGLRNVYGWVIYDPATATIRCSLNKSDSVFYEPCYRASSSALVKYAQRGISHLVGSHTYAGSLERGKTMFSKLTQTILANQSKWCDILVSPESLFSHYGMKYVMIVLECIEHDQNWIPLWKLVKDMPLMSLKKLLVE